MKFQQTATKKRRYWIHPINQRRNTHGIYHTLIQELRNPDNDDRHKQYLRMSAESFDYLLGMIENDITKTTTRMREPIEPGMKLCITLHHLAEGASHKSIASHYRLGRSTVSNAIYETCKALWKRLQPVYLKSPQNEDEWKVIAEGYESSCLFGYDHMFWYCLIHDHTNNEYVFTISDLVDGTSLTV